MGLREGERDGTIGLAELREVVMGVEIFEASASGSQQLAQEVLDERPFSPAPRTLFISFIKIKIKKSVNTPSVTVRLAPHRHELRL